jgi:hypothetical protein
MLIANRLSPALPRSISRLEIPGHMGAVTEMIGAAQKERSTLRVQQKPDAIDFQQPKKLTVGWRRTVIVSGSGGHGRAAAPTDGQCAHQSASHKLASIDHGGISFVLHFFQLLS